MEVFLSNPVVLWSIGLSIIVPLVVIALGEWAERLRKKDSSYTESVQTLRGLFLPALTAAIITTFILGWGPEIVPVDPKIVAEGESAESKIIHNAGSLIQRLVMTTLYFTLALTLLSFFSAITEQSRRQRDSWEAGLPTISRTVGRALSIILPFALVVTSVWDLDLSKFVTAIGVGSIAIAFALQNTLSSVVSGILLATDRPFKEGDWIKVGDDLGRVLDLNWRTTRLEVDGRDVVVIPNTTLLDSSFKNYTVLDKGYRDSITFGFAYKDRPNKVKDVALQVARECPQVADSPTAEVHLLSFDDSSIGYEMHFHVDTYISAFQSRRIRDDIMTRLYYAAAREGLEIPFPIQTNRTTHEGAISEGERTALALDLLRSHPVLRGAKSDVLEILAKSARLRDFGRGLPISEIDASDGGIQLLRSGHVHFETADGTTLGRGGIDTILGVRTLVGHRRNHLRTIADQDLQTVFFPADAVDAAMSEDSDLARRLHAFADAQIERFNRTLP